MKYIVSGYLTISAVVDIEAESPEEALQKAEELTTPSLCHQCASAGGDEGTWQLNEFDDPPNDAVKHIMDEDGKSWTVDESGELTPDEET
jgi:hypothetical protein